MLDQVLEKWYNIISLGTRFVLNNRKKGGGFVARLIACRDYSTKAKTKGENIVGFKVNLTKRGIEETGIDYKKDELEIEYKKNKIIITKK